MTRAYYNDSNPHAAAWLANLIADGLLPSGDVDDRPIQSVRVGDLRGYRHCHFFAGIGCWPLAGAMVGWPADRELWTGSCPCQPFSTAGLGAGDADERHLWPDFARLIRAARPAVVMGEQIAGAPGRAWVDGVLADLDGAGYAGRAVDIPACAVNAPIQRQRLYWIAEDVAGAYRGRRAADGRQQAVADASGAAGQAGRLSERHGADHRSIASWWRDPWRGAAWFACPDGTERRARPGLRLLVDGVAGRMAVPGTERTISRLKAWQGIGNAIVPQLAAEVMAAYLEVTP